MSFVRTVKKENPFIQLDKQFIGNGTLSLKATGLLTYLLSKPDGWKVRMNDIYKRFTDGETSVRSALNELVKNGYVHKYRERGEGGAFGDYVYNIYERPEYNPNFTGFSPKRENQVQVCSPKRDFPHVVNPQMDNQVHSNNDFINNDFINNDLEEEEEEKLIKSDLIHFLETLGIAFENAIKFENRLIKEKVKGFTQEDVVQAIEKSLIDFNNGVCNEPYIWAVGKLKFILDGKKIKSSSPQEKPKKSYPGKKPIRKEMLPDWFDKREQQPTGKAEQISQEEFEKQKAEIQAKIQKLRERRRI